MKLSLEKAAIVLVVLAPVIACATSNVGEGERVGDRQKL